MDIRRIVTTAALMAFLAVGTTQAHTYFIETLDSVALEDMEMPRRIQVVALETGVMDTLFDNGHIFFNVYSVPDESGRFPALAVTLEQAQGIGARYTLRLEPGDDGSAWILYEGDNANSIAEGYADLSGTDDKKDERDQWIELGAALAEEMLVSSVGRGN